MTRLGALIGAAVAALVLAGPSSAEDAPPPEVAAYFGADRTLVGAGTAHYWGFSIYRAALWTGGESFAFDKPFALSLTYTRDFTAGELAGASVEEMARITGQPDSVFASLDRTLRDCFGDVTEGDRITGLSLGPDSARFFHDGAETCTVARPDFSRHFFSVWLGEKTRLPSLRERLLGQRR